MRAADHIVDLGPGAGEHGGQVVAEGTAEEIEADPGIADRPVPGRQAPIAVPAEAPRSRSGELVVRGARQHNLKKIDVAIPLGVFCCVTGVSGSGKSTLVNEILYPRGRQPPAPGEAPPRRPRADRGHWSRSTRSSTSTSRRSAARRARTRRPTPGVFDHIRQLYSQTREARARGYKPGRFSFNVKGGRCEVCRGRRPDQDRDALPSRRLRALRAVPRQPLQPRDARGPLQGQDDRRRARDVGRGGLRVLRDIPKIERRLRDPARRRPRLHPARPAGDHSSRAARRSGSSSPPSSPRWPPATPSTSSTSPPPGCTSPTSSGCSTCSTAWSTPATRWS